MKILNMEQNSLEWLKWRTKGLGASDATIIMGLSPWFSRGQLLKRKEQEIRAGNHVNARPVKETKREADNGAMARGRRLEPIARDLYCAITGIHSTPICIIHDKYEWMRASLDGFSDDRQIILEVKCINAEDHRAALDGEVPLKYRPQVQHQLFVADNKPVLHYWSYTDNKKFKPEDRVALVEVVPDIDYQKRIIDAEKLFWYELQARLNHPSPLPTHPYPLPKASWQER